MLYVLILIVLNLMPLFFIYALHKNKKTLKSEKTREMIGSMY